MGHSYEDGWNTKPKLDEARVLAPEEPRKHRAKKDRRHWCRGKTGVEHKPVYRISKDNLYWITLNRTKPSPWHFSECGWKQEHGWNRGKTAWEPTGKWYYRCGHELGCSECGKVLTYSWRLPAKECPDWKPRT